MSTISNVATAYYELVYAIENHKSAVETRELARELLDQNRMQEQVGTMSPLDVIQAEAGVAESEQSVITTERAIKDNENTLKRPHLPAGLGNCAVRRWCPWITRLVQMVAIDVDRQHAPPRWQKSADYLSLTILWRHRTSPCSSTATSSGRRLIYRGAMD